MLRSLINSIQNTGLNNDVKSWFIVLFSILTFQIFFPPQILVYFLVPMLVLGVVNTLNENKLAHVLLKGRDLIPVSVLLLLYVVAMFFSENTHEANFKLEKKILLLFLPLIACVSSVKLTRKVLDVVCSLYCISVLVFFFVVHTQFLFMLNSLIEQGQYQDYSSYFKHELFEYHYRIWLGDLWHIHPTYLGVLVNMSILIGVYFLMTKGVAKYQKGLGIVVVVVGCLFLSLVASRMAFISLILAVGLYLFSTLKKHKVLIAFGIVLLTTLSVWGLSKTNARVKEIIETKLELPTHDNFNSVNIRIGIYSCTFDLIRENWLLGLTPGDVQSELNTCYDSKDMSFITERKYNTHNEFLNQWLSFGFIGPVLLISIFAIAFYKAISRKSFLFIGFLVICVLTCLSENLFERYHGTMFFSYFYSLFMFLVDEPKLNKG